MDMEKALYLQQLEASEKARCQRQLEAGLLVAPDGSDAPMVVSELPQPVHAGRLPARTESARRDGQICPMGTEALEHAPKEDKSSEMERGSSSHSAKFDDPKYVVMRKRTIWIALGILLVVVGAVIGGAVGGTRKAKKSLTDTELAGSSSTSASPQNFGTTVTTSSNPTPTSTPTPTPTHPYVDFKMQVWEKPNYQGRSQVIYSTGSYKLAFLGLSYHWFPGSFYETWQCSTSTCFNDTNQNGWRGVTEKEWPGPKDGENFGLVYLNVACADNYRNPGCPGPADASSYTSFAVVETGMPSSSSTRSGGSTLTTTTGSSTPARTGSASATPT